MFGSSTKRAGAFALAFVALSCVSSSAVAQVDLGIDGCDCVGDDCNYAPYCAEQIAAQRARLDGANGSVAQTPPGGAMSGLFTIPALQQRAPIVAPTAPARSQPAREGGLRGFISRWYPSPQDQGEEDVPSLQLGPRVYMTEEDQVMHICKEYEPTAGVSGWNPSQSTIQIPDEMDLKDVTVELNVTHSRVGALRIDLEAKSGMNKPRVALLKPRGWGGPGKNMLNTVFDDNSSENFPMTAKDAPYSGTYRPKVRLNRLARGTGMQAGMGGSAGAWTLRLRDVGRNPDSRTPVINNWRVKMCGQVSLFSDQIPKLSDDILQAATRAQIPDEMCPASETLTGELGGCPPSAVDVMHAIVDSSYYDTFINPKNQTDDSDDGIASVFTAEGDVVEGEAEAQGLPELREELGLPPNPWRQGWLDYIERYNEWGATLPSLGNYLETLPASLWQLSAGLMYASWFHGLLECTQAGTCGTTVSNAPQVFVLG